MFAKLFSRRKRRLRSSAQRAARRRFALETLESRNLFAADGLVLAAVDGPASNPATDFVGPELVGPAVAGGTAAEVPVASNLAANGMAVVAETARTASQQAAPSISSIGGYTNTDAGIVNGTVQMDVGQAWNGYRVVNDRRGTYTWTLSGSNFGSRRGEVFLAGRSVPVRSWNDRSIVIDPSGEQIHPGSPHNWGPMSTTLVVRRSDGREAGQGVSIVPAIRTRVFEQCTWHVAKRRIEMGLTPSASAYGNYRELDARWTPRVGEQLKWGGTAARGGYHTAIIEGVERVNAPNETTYRLTISQYNARGRNEFSTFETTFRVGLRNNRPVTVLERPAFQWGGAAASGYYR
ncbi:MAG: hypothetical protein HYV60_11915 [Planctomycetia bacterium]|nr:hypothetical protein [Planctomycetia bacterium]